jgi:hypothetical protein
MVRTPGATAHPGGGQRPTPHGSPRKARDFPRFPFAIGYFTKYARENACTCDLKIAVRACLAGASFMMLPRVGR